MYLLLLLGNTDDKTTPTLVQKLEGHMIVDVACGSYDAHTLALEDNGGSNLP